MNIRFGLAGMLALGAALTLAPAHAATFVVNSTADRVDANPGDGLCADAEGDCTLRAAIMEADSLPGWDVIDLRKINDPSQPIVLAIPGVDESFAATGGDPPWAVTGTPDPSRGDLDITDSLTIVGAGPDKTIVEWPDSAKSQPSTGDRVFHIQGTDHDITVLISHLTVRNGVTTSPVVASVTPEGLQWTFRRSGGGIAIGPGATMELVDPNKQHGKCSGEGGMEHGGGGEEDCGGETGLRVTLTDVHVVDNQSGADGGGLYNTAPLVLDQDVFSGNSAKSKGGGLYNGADLQMSNTLVGAMPPDFPKPNTAKNGGGMFDGAFHESHISDSAFVGNSGGNGGGIAGRRRVLMYVSNTTISGNVATEAGGGMSSNGQVVLQNDTVADNTVTKAEEAGVGGGINMFAMGVYSFVNTLFSNNGVTGSSSPRASCGCSGEGKCSATVMGSGGHNLDDGESCYFDPSRQDLPDTDALLTNLAYEGGATPVRALSSGSPAVDAGDNASCPNDDQRGSLRPTAGTLGGIAACDIGAYELFVHTSDLHIDDVVAPDQVYVGNPSTITIRVHNDPTATATATGVVLTTDPLPSSLAIESMTVTPGGSTSACKLVKGAVNCALGDLGVGSSATVTLEGKFAVQGDYALKVHVTSAGPVDPLPQNDSSQMHVRAVGTSALAIDARQLTPVGHVGADTSVWMTIQNGGPDKASNLRLSVDLPDGAIFKSTSFGDACTYSAEDQNLLCAFGDLAANASISGTVTVAPQSAGDETLDMAIGADQHNPTTAGSSSVALAVSSNDGGGCAFRPGAPFDPTLPAVALSGLLGLLIRGVLRRKVRARGPARNSRPFR
ncbi:MAG TPA: choice-of-anchor Q domain-containing protein [Gammaproteobacteria bacterium]|nr:choice-of-anchor Q domain-containing protein [Gammaproteobacteria bacterium]